MLKLHDFECENCDYQWEELVDSNNPVADCPKCGDQLQPEHLLAICQETERGLGRDPHDRNCPRTIDLDLLFYGQQVIDTSQLTIPHPHLHQRRFVLMPMAELDPDWVHPHLHQTIQSLLDNLTDVHQVRKLDLAPGSHFNIRPSDSPPPAT